MPKEKHRITCSRSAEGLQAKLNDKDNEGYDAVAITMHRVDKNSFASDDNEYCAVLVKKEGLRE